MRRIISVLPWSAVALVYAAGCANVPPQSTHSQGPHDVRRTVRYLASDALEGRGVDTTGIDRAADYIAGSFKQIGVAPLDSLHGYFQSFDMTVSASVGDETSLRIGDAEPLELAVDYAPVSFSADQPFDGSVVFVGYGITNPQRGYNDYANVDVKGKIVLAMRFEPHNARGVSRFQDKGWSNGATLMSKARTASEHGATALLLVNPPEYHGHDSLLPFATTFKGPRAAIPIVHVTQDVARRLLAPAGGNLASLQKDIDTSGKPRSMPIDDARVAGNVRIQRNTRTLNNVVAMLPGHGPHAIEFVVVGAHYDHVGHGTIASMSQSTDIHNGADDNASGVAAMLELAERLRRGSKPLDRSVLFVAFVAEEWGLTGSQQFVANPPIPLERISTMINMDMVGRMRNNVLYIGGYGTATPLMPIIDAASDKTSINVRTMGAGGLGPSDHMTFALKKIPVLFFFSGMHGDYHRPSDDADKINYAGIENVVNFAELTVRDLTAIPRSQYVDASDTHIAVVGDPTGSKVIPGIVPDYINKESLTGGVRIQGTVPGSPAQRAGLQAGDVIVRFGDKPVESLYDLSRFIALSTPGQKVILTIQRNGAEVQVEATMILRAKN